MGTLQGRLSQADVATLNTPGKYRFGPGLYLQVSGPDAKSWIYRFQVNRTERFMGLGSARDVTLAQARKRLDELRVTRVAKKIDPIGERRALAKAKARAMPFRDCVERYITAHEDEWHNPKHCSAWRASLSNYAFPVIGDLDANDISVSHVVEILRPMWSHTPETARRVRGRIAAVLDYSADPDNPSYRNPAALTPQLKKALPKLGRDRAPRRHAALHYDEAPAFFAALRAGEGVAALALQFTILTAARTNEVLGARWEELEGSVWTVPPSE